MDVLIGLGGGAGLAALVAVVVHFRAENRRTDAEARRTDAEGGKLEIDADAVASDAVQRRYDALFAALELEVSRVRAAEAATRGELDTVRAARDVALDQNGRLRVEIGEATGAVRIARAEIVRLQHHLDELEDRRPRKARP